jgi:hypothetical protein
MSYNTDRAIGCRIGYNAVIKAVRFVDKYEQIPPNSKEPLRRVLKEIYGPRLYNYYLHRRGKLRLVS